MNRVQERMAAQSEQFKQIYHDVQSQIPAETAFRDIFNEERRSLPELMDRLQQGNVSRITKSIPRRATHADFAIALSEATSDPWARLVLRYTSASQVSWLQVKVLKVPHILPQALAFDEDLSLIGLVPSMLRFYVWLHNDFADFLSSKGWSLEDVADLTIGQAVQDRACGRSAQPVCNSPPQTPKNTKQVES